MELKRRYYEIDLLRFIAAFLVVLYHLAFRGYSNDSISPVKYFEIDSITRYGYLGVELFFMISGFVICMSALGRSAWQFLLSRITRLYPAFWFACTLVLIMTNLYVSSFPKIGFLQYAVNMSMFQDFISVNSIDGVYWTLTYELKFYILIFLLLLIRKDNWIKYLAGLWLLYTVIYYSGYRIKYIGYFMFPEFGVFFIAGIYFYYLERAKKVTHNLIYIFLLCICFSISLLIAKQHSDDLAKTFNSTFNDAIIYGLIILFYTIFSMISLGYTRKINYKILAKLGGLTYPLYLIHHNIGYILLQNYGLLYNKYVFLTFILLLFIMVSYVINKYVEGFLYKKMNKLFSKYI